ncbi:MAG TPA: efflux RND transporter periplasmic adaptor subunit [Stellaceae bacterium]|nr:efflux RND transporter periplasmic adaptor subunit [Stellaceae bacterium]
MVAAVGAAAYAVYNPDAVESLSPRAAELAREARARLPLPPPGAAAAAQAAQESAPAAVNVEAQTVERKDFPVVLESLGQVIPYQTVTVKARVDGQIEKIAFKEGQMVKEGDLLAEIDPRPFQAALDQAVAKKQQDEANLANAKLDLARYSTLVKQSFASQQQFDTQSSLVNQLIAQTAADTAAIDAAKVQLGYTKITAPLTGRVGFRLVDQGNMVQASTQTGIVVINELQPISVTFTAPEEQVGEINALMKKGDAKVEVKSTDGKPLASGVLEVVDNHVDAATGTVMLKGRFANTDNKLWPGLAVIADLTLGVDKDAVVVQTPAVQHGVNGLYVYVIGADNKVQPRKVKIAHETPELAAISEGLKPGERIVTSGQSLLRPGSLVAVQTADSAG